MKKYVVITPQMQKIAMQYANNEAKFYAPKFHMYVWKKAYAEKLAELQKQHARMSASRATLFNSL